MTGYLLLTYQSFKVDDDVLISVWLMELLISFRLLMICGVVWRIPDNNWHPNHITNDVKPWSTLFVRKEEEPGSSQLLLST